MSFAGGYELVTVQWAIRDEGATRPQPEMRPYIVPQVLQARAAASTFGAQMSAPIPQVVTLVAPPSGVPSRPYGHQPSGQALRASSAHVPSRPADTHLHALSDVLHAQVPFAGTNAQQLATHIYLFLNGI